MEMAPQVPGDRTPYSASSSGKLKARSTMSMKRSGGGTPYERPSSAARTAQPLAQRDTGWGASRIGSGIVHSASRMLANSAVFLFNSMFKRQAPAIAAPLPEDSGLGSEDVPPLEIAQPIEDPVREEMPVAPRPEVSGSASLQDDDLENILKQKDLTREECERYINLIQSKIMDAEPGPSSQLERSTRTPKNQRVESDKEAAQAMVLWEEPPARPDRRVRFQQPQARSERWTPIQMPIGGGRELLKQRTTVVNDASPRSKELSPSKSSFSLRGPSLVPGPTLKRKPGSEAMDLACFRSTGGTGKRKPALRLDVPSVPGQSSRTAQKILDALERRSSLKSPNPDELPARPPKARVPGLKTPAVPPSVFSFPSTANGPEPPTPKPMPSPYSQEKKMPPRDGAGPAQASHAMNGLLPSFQETSFEKLGNGPESLFYSGEDAYDRMLERVEKASSILAGGAPSLTNSPSFSEGLGFPAGGGFETSSSGRRGGDNVGNPFAGWSSSLTAPTLGGSTTMTGTGSGIGMGAGGVSATCSSGGEVKESSSSSLFESWSCSSDQVWVGAAQSLAPPDANDPPLPPPPSNGALVKPRKKSSKRLK